MHVHHSGAVAILLMNACAMSTWSNKFITVFGFKMSHISNLIVKQSVSVK